MDRFANALQTMGDKDVQGLEGVSAKDVTAYRANHVVHKPGLTRADVIKHYNNTANTYEQHLSPDRYHGPVYAAEAVHRHCQDRESGVRILDVAAGTGFLGEHLQKRGFVYIDALDPSSAMLELAGGKGVYRQTICDVMGATKTEIANDTYDVVVTSGGMGENHIPCVGLLEMLRITKPGGVVVIVMRQEYLQYVKEYIERLEPFMEELVNANKWTPLERTIVPRYSFNKDGVVYVFRVMATGPPDFEASVIEIRQNNPNMSYMH